MHYVKSGRGHPFLFVHGYTDSSKLWMNQVEFFSREYMTVAIDLVGHGKSDARQNNYSVPALSEDVYRFLQKMKIQRTVLLGHSMGGMIAQQFCVDHPEAVQGLILCSTGASGRAFKEAGGFNCLATLKEVTELGFQRSVENSASYIFGNGTSSEIMNFVLSEELKTNVNAALGCLKGMWAWNVRDQLSRIRAPTLIVVGEEDRATPLACSENLKNSIVGSEMKIISNCGHMMSVERPRELNLEVQQFLESYMSAS